MTRQSQILSLALRAPSGPAPQLRACERHAYGLPLASPVNSGLARAGRPGAGRAYLLIRCAAAIAVVAAATLVDPVALVAVTSRGPGASAACAALARRVVNDDPSLPHHHTALPDTRRVACGPSPDSAAWAVLLTRLLHAAKYAIAVIGGSETAGKGCTQVQGAEVVALHACAWSARLVQELRLLWPTKDIGLVNFGIGGMELASALPSLPRWLPADAGMPGLLMVDFIVNDSWSSYHLTAVLAAYEKLVLETRRLRPLVDVLFVSTCALPKCGVVNALINSVARWHGVAVVSYTDYADALSRIHNEDASLVLWGKAIHPPWHTHQMIADTCVSCVVAGLEALCRGPAAAKRLPLSLEAHILAAEVCVTPTTLYDAATFSAAVAPAMPTQHDWDLRADSEERALGWISRSEQSSIAFPVSFGKSPRLTVTYIRSYEGFGSASMRFASASPERALVLDGLQDERAGNVSQSFSATFDVSRSCWEPQDGLSGCLGWKVAPWSSHELVFRIVAGGAPKFKITTVLAC